MNDIRRLVEISSKHNDLELKERIKMQNRVEDLVGRFALGEVNLDGETVMRSEEEEKERKAWRVAQQMRYLDEVANENIEDLDMDPAEAYEDAFVQLKAQFGESLVLSAAQASERAAKRSAG